MDFQLIILSALLYLFIGTFFGVGMVLKVNKPVSSDAIYSYMKSAIISWPLHIFLLLGCKIISWNVKNEKPPE